MSNILIIDDDEYILFGLTKVMEAFVKNSKISIARHGRQAVDILKTRSVDLIVTDLKMPIMNGYEVVAYANKNHPSIPVYVMTADYLPDVKERLRSAAISRFISKPFSFRELAAEISCKLDAEQCLVPAW